MGPTNGQHEFDPEHAAVVPDFHRPMLTVDEARTDRADGTRGTDPEVFGKFRGGRFDGMAL
jgi:hypothetical protein